MTFGFLVSAVAIKCWLYVGHIVFVKVSTIDLPTETDKKLAIAVFSSSHISSTQPCVVLADL